ncbi:hypothetical protein [Acinetobacter dispersus]|uniref:hypothetical protein n=1 Tax=Acinetobacter dispersus TaxID=70348 RepID=UPI001F4B95E0|nr:hypothetical protein [Acinetobacter dispersus]MCH7390009.1 hypothetical protein [Acinetobacter dispersus]
MSESIWSEQGDQEILAVELNIYKFCEEQKLELFEFYEEGLGKVLATHIYEEKGFLVVFTKYLDAPFSCVNVAIDASCNNVKEWEDRLINKYFKNYQIYFKLSES